MAKFAPKSSERRKGRNQADPDEARLDRKDWIKAAIVALSEASIDALRVDELAKQLGVTKGSFYWHFDTREDLLKAVLETWRSRMTTDIQAYIGKDAGSPATRLRKLLKVAISPSPDVPGGPLELTLRDWARHDTQVQQVIDEVDAERVAFLVRLYLEAGLTPRKAEDKALANIALTIGLRMVSFDAGSTSVEKRLRLATDLLLPKPTYAD